MPGIRKTDTEQFEEIMTASHKIKLASYAITRASSQETAEKVALDVQDLSRLCEDGERQKTLRVVELTNYASKCEEAVAVIGETAGRVRMRRGFATEQIAPVSRDFASESEIFRIKAGVLEKEAQELDSISQRLENLTRESDREIADELGVACSLTLNAAKDLRACAEAYVKSADAVQVVLSRLEQEIPNSTIFSEEFASRRVARFSSRLQEKSESRVSDGLETFNISKQNLELEIRNIKSLGYRTTSEEELLQIQPGEEIENEFEATRMEDARKELLDIRTNNPRLNIEVDAAEKSRRGRFSVETPQNPSAVEEVFYAFAKAHNTHANHVAARANVSQKHALSEGDKKIIKGLARRIPVLLELSTTKLQALRANPLGASLVEEFQLTPESTDAKLAEIHAVLPDGRYHPFQRLGNWISGNGWNTSQERDLIRRGYNPKSGDLLRIGDPERVIFDRKNTPEAIAALDTKIATADAERAQVVAEIPVAENQAALVGPIEPAGEPEQEALGHDNPSPLAVTVASVVSDALNQGTHEGEVPETEDEFHNGADMRALFSESITAVTPS